MLKAQYEITFVSPFRSSVRSRSFVISVGDLWLSQTWGHMLNNVFIFQKINDQINRKRKKNWEVLSPLPNIAEIVTLVYFKDETLSVISKDFFLLLPSKLLVETFQFS